ncbi:MAG TPA: hypothetical protein H9808_03135 [Candidatus Atopostipes pullistercoris]|uniref:Ribonuclease n=1 Tax=Candidatus Atopostipes pullistercoris TaxID=2838467 RepID=A0A9D2JXY7_9LACT|nr:hypothetical protein [Candidatus Atopostipes pullistercoris]
MVLMFACGTIETTNDSKYSEANTPTIDESLNIEEGQSYTEAQDLVDYLEMYGELPPNFITKKEARELGWDAKEGNLWQVAPDASIGGDYFGNYEELLPEDDQREYYEADVDYEGGHRNAKRLIYSNDGLYFYTEDHYESFEEMKPGGD